MSRSDYEIIAQQVSHLGDNVTALEARVGEVEKVNARLEAAALTTAKALQEIARHWDAVYEAMRRQEPGEPPVWADATEVQSSVGQQGRGRV